MLPRYIILSRKGFDASAGQHASPIFSDGRMLSLPIPESEPVGYTYADLNGAEGILLRSCLKKHGHEHPVHLDPDIRPELRPDAYRTTVGYFGQDRGSQTELNSLGICAPESNALFLFFGWFKGVKAENFRANVRATNEPRTHHQHVIWGWLQTDAPPTCVNDRLAYLRDLIPYHPHVTRPNRTNNFIYVSRPKLSFNRELNGMGVFSRYAPALRLTCPNTRDSRSEWVLPSFFQTMARGRSASAKWTTEGQDVRFQAIGFGQEFVFDTEGFETPVSSWLQSVFAAK